ncbi:hypothetical protein LCGC14_1160750 [marine sediment metagenome]|uniref:Uncharacterized protein n=1 Tax=marine sediment metagenome TaxID=412755 RepID=A0A0F9LSK1_9ZZZZ
MIIQFHTPGGVVEIDTETATDNELVLINMTREEFNMFLASQPRNLLAEIDELKATYDADADGRIERDALEWEAGKLLKGAGEGVDPVLIDVPTGNARIASGTYPGNVTVNRAIAHGLGVIPKIVMVHRSDLGTGFNRIVDQSAFISYVSHLAVIKHAVTAMTDTNFYVGNATNYLQSANNTGQSYDWVAIG